ncbi:DUF4245 domain-containing protein [Micromonospora avicenniae]|uniref:DUF4245 domain-containing protein n=1 Tax=Micromonospora avicenniae TaxID=1198245 RepID=A0A1N7AGF6_9ACTN|nr:DUF4245 domain-containing protein [Micromonospora avicenniae]SIR38063.1 Protein of unknown function [Micromonospora avicenniae]
MEPAQPADRVPADRTPTDGPTPATEARIEADGQPAGEPALVASAGAARQDQPEPAAAPLTSSAPPAPAEVRRSDRSPKDMAISLLVLLIPIALLLAFYRGFLGGDQPTPVDPAPAVEQAQDAKAFPVSQPAGLGEDWRPVNARYQTAEGGSTLRIGYVTPEGKGAQLLQSNVPAEQFIPTELTDRAQPQGQVELNGRNWQRYTARENEQALVLLEPDRTVMVVGDARENELRELAGSLR